MKKDTFEPSRHAYSIVVLGDFNPAILQPLWFSANELMPSEETATAEIAVISKEIAVFSVGNTQVQVDKTRLSLTTTDPAGGPILRDLAIGTLEVLEHTPLNAIGLNRDADFAMKSEEAWYAVGDRLVPKSDWKAVLNEPRMQSVAVTGKSPISDAGYLLIRIQPSSQLQWGVFVAVNQHYVLKTEERLDPRERQQEAIRILQDDWLSFCTYAENAGPTMLSGGKPEVC